MTWTTELANAEAAETTYRTNAKGSFLPNYYRLDQRGAFLLGEWVRARAAASSTKVPPSNQSYWGNVAARAVVAMGASWSIVQGQLNQGAASTPFLIADGSYGNAEMSTHAPLGFYGPLDGLFGGLLSQWAGDVWLASGRTHGAGFPPQEFWSFLFANSLTLAGPT